MFIKFANIHINTINFYYSFLIVILVPAIIIGNFAINLVLLLYSITLILVLVKNKLYNWLKNPLFVIILTVMLYYFFRSLMSVDPKLSLESTLFYFRYLLMSFLICYIFLKKPIFYKIFLITITVILFVVMADGHIQYFLKKNILGIPMPNSMRLTGLFGKEEIIGSFISRLLPLALLFFTEINKKNFLFIFFLILFILMSISTTLISGQRSSFFYTILILIITSLLNKKLQKYTIASIVIGIIFTIITINFSTSIKVRMIDETLFGFGYNYQGSMIQDSNNYQGIKAGKNYAFKVGNSYVVGGKIKVPKKIRLFSKLHEKHYDLALNMFKDNIFFGQGPKLFRYLCSKEKFHTKYKDEGCSTHPHNTYIQLLSETGLIGMFPVMMIFIICCFFLIKKFVYNYFYKQFDKVSDTNLCLITCFFISTFPFIPTGNFFSTWLSTIYFLPLGILMYKNNIIKI